MKLLLLLFFCVAGTQAYTIYFKNNCASPVTVTTWQSAGLPGGFTLNAGQSRIVSASGDSSYEEPGTYAGFFAGGTDVSLKPRGSPRSALLTPRCAGCPGLLCVTEGCPPAGLAWRVPANTNFDLVYCA